MLKDEKYWCECVDLLSGVVDSTRFPEIENTIATINRDIIQVMLKEEKEHRETLEEMVPKITESLSLLDDSNKKLKEIIEGKDNIINELTKNFHEARVDVLDLDRELKDLKRHAKDVETDNVELKVQIDELKDKYNKLLEEKESHDV